MQLFKLLSSKIFIDSTLNRIFHFKFLKYPVPDKYIHLPADIQEYFHNYNSVWVLVLETSEVRLTLIFNIINFEEIVTSMYAFLFYNENSQNHVTRWFYDWHYFFINFLQDVLLVKLKVFSL